MIRHFPVPYMYMHLKEKTFKVLTVVEGSVNSNSSTQEASGGATPISAGSAPGELPGLSSLTSGSQLAREDRRVYIPHECGGTQV